MAGVSGSSKQQYAAARMNMPEVLNLVGTFTTNGAAPVRVFGRGWAVTQQGTGIYRVTFNINTTRFLSCNPTLIKAAPSATWVEIQDMLPANNYVTIRVFNATGTTVAPGAVSDQITFDMNVMTVKLPVV